MVSPKSVIIRKIFVVAFIWRWGINILIDCSGRLWSQSQPVCKMRHAGSGNIRLIFSAFCLEESMRESYFICRRHSNHSSFFAPIKIIQVFRSQLKNLRFSAAIATFHMIPVRTRTATDARWDTLQNEAVRKCLIFKDYTLKDSHQPVKTVPPYIGSPVRLPT